LKKTVQVTSGLPAEKAPPLTVREEGQEMMERGKKGRCPRSKNAGQKEKKKKGIGKGE